MSEPQFSLPGGPPLPPTANLADAVKRLQDASSHAAWAADEIEAEDRVRGDLDHRTTQALAAHLRSISHGYTRPHTPRADPADTATQETP